MPVAFPGPRPLARDPFSSTLCPEPLALFPRPSALFKRTVPVAAVDVRRAHLDAVLLGEGASHNAGAAVAGPGDVDEPADEIARLDATFGEMAARMREHVDELKKLVKLADPLGVFDGRFMWARTASS